jgi:hypothetical protein
MRNGMTSDLALTIAMAAGWMALVVAFVWPASPHCRCCSRQYEDEAERRLHR